MEKIIINTNYATTKTAFNLKMELSTTPFLSTSKFCWGDNRFIVEHLSKNNWTIAIENASTETPLYVAYNIHTRELSEILDKFFV